MEIRKVEVLLLGDDYEVPNAFGDLIRVSEVHCFDKHGKLVRDYEPLKKGLDFFKANYQDMKDLIEDVAKSLKVRPEMIEVE
ncbi:hypothetical protein [Planococcus lenghuensis]|uniref:Uncharacterized protein n=1 Tax=Planococcus lenghuensis TaxID=2213202 RepID=A0A1Q2KZQ7_9BACL|nr:hypothetical protein [Planococcus lenghuensis]AQQ53680.1 hypothetical protein B0X71_11720 [Planococcus lenghuensis]